MHPTKAQKKKTKKTVKAWAVLTSDKNINTGVYREIGIYRIYTKRILALEAKFEWFEKQKVVPCIITYTP